MIFSVWGCQTVQRPVNIYGESVDLKLLEGEWKGHIFVEELIKENCN